jgi:hypothetical protein
VRVGDPVVDDDAPHRSVVTDAAGDELGRVGAPAACADKGEIAGDGVSEPAGGAYFR